MVHTVRQHHRALYKMSPSPYEFPKNPSPQLEVLQKYYAFLSVFDLDNLNTLFTDDFAQKTLPASLGVPDKSKKDFFAFLGRLQADFKGQNLNYAIYDINDGVGKIWVHAKLEANNIEIVYFFQFGTGVDALKIASITGFADSRRYLEL